MNPLTYHLYRIKYNLYQIYEYQDYSNIMDVLELILSENKKLSKHVQLFKKDPTDAFLTIDLPLAKSGIAVAAIFTFIFTWNDAFYATLLGGKNITTFAAILPSYFVRYVPQWTHLTAAGTLYIIPSVIFAILMFKLIQHGLKLKL